MSGVAFNGIGIVPTLNLQRANGAFTLFHIKLQLPLKEDRQSFFLVTNVRKS